MPGFVQDDCFHERPQPLCQLLTEVQHLLETEPVNEFQLLRWRALLQEALLWVEVVSLPNQDDHASSCLTHRELQIAMALSTGQTNSAIAEHLYISVNTVRFHIGNILRKLNAKNRSEAAAMVGRWRASTSVPHVDEVTCGALGTAPALVDT